MTDRLSQERPQHQLLADQNDERRRGVWSGERVYSSFTPFTAYLMDDKGVHFIAGEALLGESEILAIST